ncbi:MAG: hypothetical protein CO141_00885 [Candidatus Moranbacteria bacterium CG_4_9_14_3_um_filter_42_9]|nr:MAG: hypothetical protein CO141_00885 [Candidatus Moranbacteria bacterium CG_4_9_14_3_um_filter_42_9]
MIQLEDKLYTSTEVADILGVSLRSVYRYLEEDKLTAEVKTATGRHRFSKKNILDFLYPNGESVAKVRPETSAEVKTEVNKVTTTKKVSVPIVEEEKPIVAEEIKEEVVAEEVAAVEEEPVDWLAKFREAAKKYREEAEKEPVGKTVVEETMSMADTINPKETEEIPEPAAEEPAVLEPQTTRKNFYRSSLGGLKDIAQNIDKGSRTSYLDYAFTLNAGLSLYKPIKPFSMLHVYVRPTDLVFFEKLLGLTPTDETNSQLCLVVSGDDAIYKAKEELHGLFVVSKARLLTDIAEMGDSALVSEASSILK